MIPQDSADIQLLGRAVEQSRERMQVFREERYHALQQYVGAHYGNEGAQDIVPVNLLELAVSIYVFNLAGGTPQMTAKTELRRLKPRARSLEIVANKQLKKMKFKAELQRVIKDAIFTVGVMKIGRRVGGAMFARCVDFDDFIIDMGAKRLDMAAFIGNRYRIPLDEARANRAFDRSARKDLQATPKMPYNDDGDERAQTIGEGVRIDPDEAEEYVELIDIYKPRDKCIVTMPAETMTTALRVDPYKGPNPYRLLGFDEVSGNLLPLAPAHHMIDLHELMNRLARKIGRQADRQKVVGLAKRQGAADAERVKEANDGDIILVDDVASTGEMSFGGVDPRTLATFLQFKDVFSWINGNLETLGGLSPQADTLGQEKMLGQNASVRFQHMSESVNDFVVDIFMSIASFLWNDPNASYQVNKTVPGTNIIVTSQLGPMHRMDAIDNFDIELEAFSLRPQSPGEKLAMLQQTLTGLYIPAGQLMASQGIAIDFREVTRQIARLTHMPELEDILIFANQEPLQESHGSTKPANTTRTEERISRPGATRQGNDGMLAQLLVGGGAQPSQGAALGRAVG